MIPENRNTEFGTLNEALKLTIYFTHNAPENYSLFKIMKLFYNFWI